jgi:hypothetical protein
MTVLKKIANAFDVALICRFESWSDFMRYFNEGAAIPKSFDEELALLAAGEPR